MATYNSDGFIIELDENEIFVFGSNIAGRHGKGAALQAARQFGAVYGIGEGLQGRSYAFPTLNQDLKKLSRIDIIVSIGNLVYVAREHPEYTFLMTKVGAGLAGFSEEEMIEIFREYVEVLPFPPNIQFPADWHEQIFS